MTIHREQWKGAGMTLKQKIGVNLLRFLDLHSTDTSYLTLSLELTSIGEGKERGSWIIRPFSFLFLKAGVSKL